MFATRQHGKDIAQGAMDQFIHCKNLPAGYHCYSFQIQTVSPAASPCDLSGWIFVSIVTPAVPVKETVEWGVSIAQCKL